MDVLLHFASLLSLLTLLVCFLVTLEFLDALEFSCFIAFVLPRFLMYWLKALLQITSMLICFCLFPCFLLSSLLASLVPCIVLICLFIFGPSSLHTFFRLACLISILLTYLYCYFSSKHFYSLLTLLIFVRFLALCITFLALFVRFLVSLVASILEIWLLAVLFS